MNKKIFVFLCILSLLVPFIPSFDLVVCADDSVSVDLTDPDYVRWLYDETGLYLDLDDSSNPLYPYKMSVPFGKRVEWFLADNGYVVKDPVSAIIDSVQSITDIQILEKVGAEQLYQYAVDNNYPSISQNVVNNTVNYAENNLDFVFRRTCQVSEFYNQILPLGNNATVNGYIDNLFRMLKPIVNANSSFVYIFTDTSYDLSFGQSFIYGIDKTFFTENQYSFYTLDSNFRSDYYKNDYGLYRAPNLNSTNVPYSLPGYLWLVSGNSILPYVDTKSVTLQGYQNTQSSVSDVRLTSASHKIFEGARNFLQFNKDINFYGSVLLVADSVSEFEIPIFKSNGSAQLFYSGESPVYTFDSDFDLSKFGTDIDYSRLYDIISNEVRHSTGNVVNAINNAANDYLQQQIDLLHDINNALNDGNGQSWLRRIYGILDYNFPLTLNAFQDLIDAVQNISVSGGGGDFSEATQVLHDIDTKLGILIDEPFTDLTDDDWNSMKSRVQTKFPFCIFSDIVAISVILNRPPQQPDLNFVVPIIGTESENMVHIDLSPYEHARPYVHGVLIFVFIIGLLALSVKIFDHLKS